MPQRPELTRSPEKEQHENIPEHTLCLPRPSSGCMRCCGGRTPAHRAGVGTRTRRGPLTSSFTISDGGA